MGNKNYRILKKVKLMYEGMYDEKGIGFRKFFGICVKDEKLLDVYSIKK